MEGQNQGGYTWKFPQFKRRDVTRMPCASEKILVTLMLAFMMLFAPLICLHLTQRKHGSFFLVSEQRQASMSVSEAKAHMSLHKFLHIGGPHRGGTTLLWKLLATHPNVSGFVASNLHDRMTQLLPGGDFSVHADDGMRMEGLYLQSVYPLFGLNAQTGVQGVGLAVQREDGLGKYALVPGAHLTETSALVTSANKLKLFRQWAKFWDLSKPVLLEKSPPNMMWMRFLQAMLPNTHHLVISRHPIATSLAHQRWGACASIPLPILVRNWISQHKYMLDDSKRVSKFMFVRFEDFVMHPQRFLDQICQWMGLPQHTFKGITVSNSTNGKYMTEYRHIRETPRGQSQHEEMVNEFEHQLQAMALGYSMNDLDYLTTTNIDRPAFIKGL